MRGRIGGMIRRILYALQTLRLIAFMIAGADVGRVVGLGAHNHSFEESVSERFRGAIIGAFCGLAVELVVRQLLPIPQRDIQPPRFSLRTLLIATTLVAV